VAPKEVKYYDDDPLKLNNNFQFFHNKNKFRKDLNNLQYLIKDYLKIALHAPGIRDSYINQEYTESSLILIFTTPDMIHNANKIFETCEREIGLGCYYVKTTSEYIFLKANDMKGMRAGLDVLYEIFKQTLEDYFNQKKFEDYIKIRPFEIYSCT